VDAASGCSHVPSKTGTSGPISCVVMITFHQGPPTSDLTIHAWIPSLARVFSNTGPAGSDASAPQAAGYGALHPTDTRRF
jgi:hypothetical protein